MPNPDGSPTSMKEVAPPPRSWLRTAFFKLNFPFASLFALSCFNMVSLSYENVFLAALAASAVLIYAACEAVGLFNHSVALERGLGIANLVFGAVVSLVVVVGLTKPEPQRAPDSLGYVLLFAPIVLGFIVYLFVCGFLRLKWTRKSDGV